MVSRSMCVVSAQLMSRNTNTDRFFLRACFQAPVSVFAPNLFGFVDGSYYRDLLVLALGFMLFFFGLLVTAVTFRMKELR